MRISQFKRITALLMALFMVIPCFTFIALADEDATVDTADVTTATFDEFKELLNALSYDEYQSEHKDAHVGEDVIVIKGSDYNKELSTDDEDAVYVVEEGKELYDEIIATDASKDGQKFVYTSEDDGCKITWNFKVENAGMYNIAVEYYPVVGRHSAIERKVMIDGEYPFKETRYINLSNTWRFFYLSQERDGAFFVDLTGNEIRPAEVPLGLTVDEAIEKFGKSYRLETPEWRTAARIHATHRQTTPGESSPNRRPAPCRS